MTKNRLIKNLIIYSLVILTCFVSAVPGTAVFAETPPYVDDYIQIKVNVNGKSVDDAAFTIKGNVYIKTSTLKKYGNTDNLTIDTNNSRITFDASELDIDLGSEKASEFVKKNAGTCYLILKRFKDENNKYDYFVSIGSVARFSDLAYRYADETLYLTQLSESGNMGKTISLSSAAPSISNNSIVNLSTGETVFITGETKSFYKVETLSGNSYYVNKDEVKKYDNASDIADFEYTPGQKDSFSGKINAVWLNLSDNAARTPLPPERTGGIDVICPPWMHQTVNNNGTVSHICDYGYVQLAHSLGYKVWICANNCFTAKGSTNYTSKVMKSEELSDRVIAQYLLYACIYDADGINIDYETMYNSGDRELFTAFCTKLSEYCDLLGLTFSVATAEPTASGKKIYDFEALGNVCDYVMPMLYGENTAKNVGSVSSYSYYSKHISTLKTMIPAEKILMGVPFFSRYYLIKSNGSIASSNTITMLSSKERLAEYNASAVWSEKDRQFVATGSLDGKTFKVWLEDQHSVACRLSYVYESGIAGTACWALDQQSDGILEIFEAVNKYGADPSKYYSEAY